MIGLSLWLNPLRYGAFKANRAIIGPHVRGISLPPPMAWQAKRLFRQENRARSVHNEVSMQRPGGLDAFENVDHVAR